MTPSFVCHGCGAVVDPTRAFPFACPNAGAPGDDIDHVLVAPTEARGRAQGDEDNPFLRYRQWLTPYRLARAVGLSDAAWAELVGELDLRLQAVDGRGFRVTPMARQPALAAALGLAGDLWIKDETRNVSGSHKGRHLMGVMLYLSVLERSGLALGKDLRARRLAISSCGNAALAAAAIARAADWPLDVFIPVDAEPSVVRRLGELGAAVVVCERRGGEAGDPCVRAARARGRGRRHSIQRAGARRRPRGGRRAHARLRNGRDVRAPRAPKSTRCSSRSAAAPSPARSRKGSPWRSRPGSCARAPRLIAVQTAGCAPLARAWRRLDGADLNEAARRRSRFMWPWESAPASLAHGILDDETYDWWEVVKAMRETGGDAIVADEAAIARALSLARAHTAIPVSATGAAGLAGALVSPCAGRSAAAVFSGVERGESV